MTRRPDEWKDECRNRIGELHDGDTDREDMLVANAEMIERALRGQGPDDTPPVAALGAHMAVNIAAMHIASFCDPDPGKKAYQNGYDRGTFARLGDRLPDTVKTREVVDALLEQVTDSAAPDMYFGSVELNGSGVRFYGDFCLVLREVAGETVVLNSNSYDLVRPPMTPRDQAPDPAPLAAEAQRMSGRWPGDVPSMATLKVLALQLASERRLTTGQISDLVLDDEDYLEVLRIGTFGHGDLHEVRLSAADVAAETQILENTRLGPAPSAAELEWRKHRRAATAALARKQVRVRVVTTGGRVR